MEAEDGDDAALDFTEHANAESGAPTVVRVLPYVFKVDQVDPLSMTAFASAPVMPASFWKTMSASGLSSESTTPATTSTNLSNRSSPSRRNPDSSGTISIMALPMHLCYNMWAAGNDTHQLCANCMASITRTGSQVAGQ